MIRRFAVLALAATALLTGLLDGQPVGAAYPGANGKIVWISPTQPSGFGTWDIWTMNPDGTGPANISPGGVDEEHPAWSPEGERIAFARVSGTPSGCFQGDIYVMDSDGSNVRQLTTNPLGRAANYPTWSPDGTRIAYTQGQQDETCNDGDSEIWVMNADGTAQAVVTSGEIGAFHLDDEPVWSPDGERIAFTGFRVDASGNSPRGIFTVRPDGSQLTRLTGSPISFIDASAPAWSPDGQRIAYERKDGRTGSHEIWMMNADGSGHTAVTRNGFLSNMSPAWSPDGQQIAFSGQDDQITFDNEIFVINVDGTGQTAITHNTTGDSMPDWQPRRTSADVVVTDCADPQLAGLTVVAGNLVVHEVPGCDAVSLPTLSEVSGNLTITDNGGATVVNLAELATVGGNLVITGNSAAGDLDLGSLTAVSGDLTITGNSAAGNLDLGSLTEVSGDLTITGNGAATVVNLPELATVGGDLALQSAGATVSVSGATVSGDLTLTANGAGTVAASTGGGSTAVTMLGGTASMRVFLPDGTFAQPVPFTIERQSDGPVEQGTTAEGAPAAIDPLAGYRFTFAVPTLNQQAQLSFTVDLAQLDAATRAALLAGITDGTATLVVKRDEAGAGYQAFARCTGTQGPAADGCVAVVPLDLAGGTPAPGAEPAFVRFDGVAGSFSTWAVALVGPRPVADATPPVIVPTLSGTLGTGGFYTSDVSVSWSVEDLESAIAQQNGCGVQAVTSDTAGITFTCEATSAGGTAARSVTIRRDATPPTITGSRTPAADASVWNNDAVTVSFACADALSGVASCPAPSTITTEGRAQSVTGIAMDAAGNQASATVGGINIDRTPPNCTASANPGRLWPPDHRLVSVNVSVGMVDSLSGAVRYTLLSATSNEPDNGPDDGNTVNDIQGFEAGTADLSGALRAERSGSGSGRIYTLTYQVADLGGNSAACRTQVTVPPAAR